MRRRTKLIRSAIVAVFAVAIMLQTVPASAEVTGTVPNHATVNGHDLYGLTVEQARSAILAQVVVPRMAGIRARAADRDFLFDPASAVAVDWGAMLEQAWAATATPTFELTRTYAVRTDVTARWASVVAKRVNTRLVNSKWVVSGHVLTVTASSDGRAVDWTGTKNALSALVGKLSTGRRQAARLVLPVTVKKAATTRSNIGKAILVVRSTRRLSLYQGPTRLKYYRCAVGQSAYPTPLGTFKIIKKNPAPDWTNPYSPWSMNMPAYIPPGPSNPLGTRALYLNADGIRIHGTNNVDSIGTAASHGCVRLVRHDIEELYPLVPLNTPVFIVD